MSIFEFLALVFLAILVLGMMFSFIIIALVEKSERKSEGCDI